MKYKFTKMHGLGNDFVLIECMNQPIKLSPEQLRYIANRRIGIGCDQILLVEKAKGDADFCYRIFNADGNEVEQCGNGARCFARYVFDQGMTKKKEIRVETFSGIITPKLAKNGEITINMGAPKFEPAEIPFITDARKLIYPLDINGKEIEFSVLSMGNPHAVQITEDINKAQILTEGALIENHSCFPQNVNAEYMQILNRKHINLRVYERGVGETPSCGTGACAAVVAGITRGLLDSTVKVSTIGGNLSISWKGKNNPVWMTGPATSVFYGEIEL
ncbi:MAG: diaminopimelate epimerase [Nitrosomonadaceae bacterium]|nr:diaminopimelate epimerase [Nitrosomonadaceae bacterium]|tara:strand:+ start:14687 stop:15514 length:828 start_codon:yes stop_codon:yes gene_type:complete